MAGTWETRLQNDIATIPAKAQRTAEIYNELGPWIRRYRGGLPIGFLASMIRWESNGQMDAPGDPALGEVGYLQVMQSFPGSVGLPAASRYDPETNIFLGSLEYQIEAVDMWRAQPRIALGSAECWKLARCSFSIGNYGTRTVMKKALEMFPGTLPGQVWSSVVNWANRTGAMRFGGIGADKIWYRIVSIDVQWEIGARFFPPIDVGAPVKLPDSPAGAYTLPSRIAPFMPSPLRGDVLALGLGALAFLA